MDVKALVTEGSGEEIRDAIVTLSKQCDTESLILLQDFLRFRDSHTYYKHAVPHMAALALLFRGIKGVEMLQKMFYEAPGSIYPTAIMASLWSAANGQPLNTFQLEFLPAASELLAPLPDETRTAAASALRDIVADSLNDKDTFFTLLNFVYQKGLELSVRKDTKEDSRQKLLLLFAEASLKISPSLLVNFKNMINESESEETYHKFLKENPIFLDPLAQTASKTKLGVEFVTDFVVRRYDDKYLLVEIEKPQDRMFTQSNDFSAHFSHALGQILDFQAWVEENAAYAQKSMPNIASPRGLLIMGRRSDLSELQKKKLHRLNLNLANIEIVTFDDLHTSAVRLYKNLYHSTEE